MVGPGCFPGEDSDSGWAGTGTRENRQCLVLVGDVGGLVVAVFR